MTDRTTMTSITKVSSFNALKKIPAILLSSLLGIMLSACNDKTNFDFENSPPPVAPSTSATFSPASGGPTTNNLLLGADGRLRFPNPDNANPVRTALNTLDGFSTVNPITLAFANSLDPASLTIGKSIRVFKVNRLANGAITSVINELSSTQITASATGDDNKTLALVPLLPLEGGSTYMVILTNGMAFANGKAVSGATDYLILRSQDDLTQLPAGVLPDLTQALQLQGLINSMEDAAIRFSSTNTDTTDDIAEEDITLSWSFTTQTITTVLQELADNAVAGTLITAPVPLPSPAVGVATAPGGTDADIYVGTLEIPYYLKSASTPQDTAPLTEFWQESAGLNSAPVLRETLTIPVMMTIPNDVANKPANGWPIVIYQHGITRTRTDVLAHAQSLASQGLASIAIDLPLHGLTEKTLSAETPLAAFHADNTAFPNDKELTFGLDLVNNTTNAPSPDGITDSSGTHFLNLSSLLTSRDNIRQGVSNLLVLRRSLANMQTLPGLTVADIDATKVSFIAHSLGGFIGIPYLAVEDLETPTSLVTTGGGIAQLVNGSPTRGPTLRAGLAAAGITENADLQAFLGAAQMILDAADPVNYAALAASKHPIHMIEVIGDGSADNLPDQTVPNKVPQDPNDPDIAFIPVAPLSGTDPIARIMELTQISNTGNNDVTSIDNITKFTKGEHGSLLTPKKGDAPDDNNTDLLDVFIEMHVQIATFLSSRGTNLTISNSSILESGN